MIKTKELSRIITIILLVSMILRFCFVITHIKHECTHDEHCTICTIINKFKEDLNYIPIVTKIINTIIVLSIIMLYIINQIIDKKKYTLVGLKVELIN